MHLAALGANRRRSPWLGKTGRPTDPPLDRRTGEGRVDATPGHYRDALAKGNIVHQLATESTGALSPPVILLLKTLAKATQGATGHDSTQHGLGRASPQSFYPHYLAAIPSVIDCADALTIRNHAASLTLWRNVPALSL